MAEDLALIAIDLPAHGATAVARRLLLAYREAGGDPGPEQLVALFAAVSVLARLKAPLTEAAGARQAGANGEVELLLAAAERFAWRARGERVLIVCGAPGSGKSTLAERLASMFDLAVLNSEMVRRELAGVAPDCEAAPELYDEAFSLATYALLGRRAARLLAEQGGVIVDATFRRADDRDAFDAELGIDAPRVYVECLAAPRALLARAAADDRSPVTDAPVALVEQARRLGIELSDLPADSHLLVRTDRELEAVVADVLALLDERVAPAPELEDAER